MQRREAEEAKQKEEVGSEPDAACNPSLESSRIFAGLRPQAARQGREEAQKKALEDWEKQKQAWSGVSSKYKVCQPPGQA